MQQRPIIGIIYICAFCTFISICSLYAFGLFDSIYMEYVENKRYELGGFTYTGNLVDGKFQNKGIITLGDKMCVGEFKKGKFDGFFTYSDNNDFLMYGVYQDGDIVGGGIKIQDGGIAINKDNEIKYRSGSGWEYTGKLGKNGQYGFGKFTYKDGSSYEGDFSKGLANGEGDFRCKNMSYTGDFLSGLFDGFGVYKFGNTEYVGEFVKGLPQGQGIYTSKDGWQYEGGFKEGVFNGEGVITNVNGEKTKSIWNDGRRVM
ncbi:MAG: hypothetical protein J6Y29_05885 [Clostridiales bacterium]|nr:hypothetical protein [Clostridiales bacterium]